jgi:hypothetical protein
VVAAISPAERRNARRPFSLEDAMTFSIHARKEDGKRSLRATSVQCWRLQKLAPKLGPDGRCRSPTSTARYFSLKGSRSYSDLTESPF